MPKFFNAQTLGFYCEDVHGPRMILVDDPAAVDPGDDPNWAPPQINVANPETSIPLTAVEISDDLYAELMEDQSAGKEITVDPNGLPTAIAPAAKPLADVKTEAKQLVDLQAEDARRLYITDGAGQALTYLEKEKEAVGYTEADTPDPNNYPLLQACVGADGATIDAVASTVIANANIWKQAAVEIEGTRRHAKWEIDNAADKDAVDTVLAGLTWPNPS